MPVARYHDFVGMPCPARAASALRALRALKGLAAACTAPELTASFGVARVGPRGVRRFRSVEEADA